MPPRTHLHFEDVAAPVELRGCPELIPIIRDICPGWPVSLAPADPRRMPFFEVEAAGEAGMYDIFALRTGVRQRFDAVNAVCDLVAALPMELLETYPDRLCLHSAAVEAGGRLIVFPSARRAGKSTLTAALSRLGHPVFTDDYLTLGIDAAGRFTGHANGIRPRLRRPLPDDLGTGFRAWVAAHRGAENAQYTYLDIDCLAPRGRALPVGAVILLDRQEGAAPRLEAAEGAEAVATLLRQNFARAGHSGNVMKAVTGLFRACPVSRLVYGSAEAAAGFISGEFSAWEGPVPADASLAGLTLGAATEEAPAVFAPERVYRCRAGTEVARIEGDLYLADAAGRAVHRLNEGSLAIWTLLEEPMSLDAVAEVLAEHFRDAPADRLREDAERTMRFFAEAGLITEAP